MVYESNSGRLVKSLLTFTNVLPPLIPGGCAMGWSRPNTSEAEFKLDRFQCEQQAASMFPVVIASIGSGHEAPSQPIARRMPAT
jgi:hypothetical protein